MHTITRSTHISHLIREMTVVPGMNVGHAAEHGAVGSVGRCTMGGWEGIGEAFGVWSGYLDRRKIRPFTIKRETVTREHLTSPGSGRRKKGQDVVTRCASQ